MTCVRRLARSGVVVGTALLALGATASVLSGRSHDSSSRNPPPPPPPGLPSTEAPPENPTRLLVKVKKGASPEQIEAAHARAGAKLLQDLPQIRWQIVEVPYGKQREVRSRYAAEPAIERADLDRARKAAYVPNDPYWPYHWHLTNIKADLAWDTVKGDPSVVVAVMDTGLETSHPDLAANVWVNPGEIAGNGVDDDGNGYVDDVNGYDFAYGDPSPDDVYGHGTACAGIVAAVQDNAIGVTGVAPRSKLAGIKAAINSGYFYDSANVPAFLYCADMGFKVISMSFFSDEVTPAERDAVDYCWSKGVVLVAAAGNSTSVIPYYPGAYEKVIAVAATDTANNPAWFTDYGSWVDVAAPGVSIATTSTFGGYTTGFAGTSAATPHVAGLAALLFAANSSATNADVRAALEDTATPTIWAPWQGEYTNDGKVDCDAAVDRVQGVTSGSMAPRMLFAAPVGGGDGPAGRGTAHPRFPGIGFYGVGFEKPNRVSVGVGGRRAPLLLQDRRVVVAELAPGGTPPLPGGFNRQYTLGVNGSNVGSIVWEGGPGWVYAPTDVGSYYSSVAGGFREIYRTDGNYLAVDDDGFGSIYCDMPVRKVWPRAPTKLTIDFTRAYAGANGATETLYLYDWSTWSYPYGSFIVVWSRAISSSAQEKVSATITTNPGNYLDDEGTMYFVLVATSVPTTGQLDADSFRVRAEE